jgi:uncharacterized protein YqeY
MLLQRIKAAQLAARKAHDDVRKTLLTTIIGEAEMVGKSAGNRESTDVEVLQVLKKFEKNQIENQKIYIDRRLPEAVAEAEFEIEVIRSFLPAKLTDMQVQTDIGTVMQQLNLSREQKSQGAVVKALKEMHGNAFDGQQVSTMFKNMLA